MNKLLLIDFDGTLTAPALQGGSVVFHHRLIDELAEAQKAGARVIGFTSYQVKFNLKMNLSLNNTRLQVIQACQERGLEIKEVLTTASPYAEVMNPKKYPFGQYYIKKIKPIEIEALSLKSLETRDNYIASKSNIEAKYLDKPAEDSDVAELRQRYRQLDEAAYQKGKEEMFRYVKKTFPGADIEVYDDNEAVINVARQLGITEHLIRFVTEPPVPQPVLETTLPPKQKPIKNSEEKSQEKKGFFHKLLHGDNKLKFDFFKSGDSIRAEPQPAPPGPSTNPDGAADRHTLGLGKE